MSYTYDKRYTRIFKNKLTIALGLGLVLAYSASLVTPFFMADRAMSASSYSNSFESNTENWTNFGGTINRVPSGTNGIASANGDFHAEVAGGVYTQWGGYETTFPANGYTTEVSVYLDTALADGSDKRIDFSSAINNPAGTHRRDFIFHLGTGTAGNWLVSASNNSPGWPGNPARSPITINTSGWYTLHYEFLNNGSNVLEVVMSLKNAGGTTLGSWSLSDPSDVIGSTVGGHRYGWFVQQQPADKNYFASLALAVDNALLVTAPPPPTVEPCVAPATVHTTSLSTWNLGETRATGHNELVSGGLRIWTEGSTSTDKAAGYYATDFPLSGLGDQTIADALDYTASFGALPGLQLVTDFDNNGTPDGILVGEAVYGNNWWLTNSAQQFVKDNAPNTGGGHGSNWFGTPNEWLAKFPDAKVKSIGYSLGSGAHGDGIITQISLGCVNYTFGLPPNMAPVVNFVDPTPAENAYVRGAVTGHVLATDDYGMGSYYVRVWKNAFESGAPNLVHNNCWSAPGAFLLGTTQDVSCVYDTTTNPDGKYVFSAQFQDGHIVWGQSLRTFFVDNTAPNVWVKGDGNSYTPTSVGNHTTDNYQKVSFKLNDGGSKIDKLTLNGVPKDLSNNNWSDLNNVVPGTFGAVEGANTLVVYDVAGNTTTYNFVLDTTAPSQPQVLGIFKGHNSNLANYVWCGGLTNNPQIRIDWADNPEGDIAYYWFGTKINQKYQKVSASSYYDENIVPGNNPYYYTVIAVDHAGNESPVSAQCNMILDQEAPVAFNISLPNNSVVNGAVVTQSWGSSATDVHYYIYESYHDPAGLNLRWHEGSGNTSKTATNVAEATYWWRVRATDFAGNEGPWSPLWKLTIDNTAPLANITSHSSGDSVAGTINLVGTVVDNNPKNSYFRIEKTDGTFVKDSLFTDSRTTHELSWDTSSVTDGDYNIFFETRDQAGNKAGTRAAPGASVKKITLTVDNTAPIVTVDPLADSTNTTPTITGTVNDPTADIEVVIDGGTPLAATNNGDGTWELAITTPLAVGSHFIEATASDDLNNTTTPAAAGNYTVTEPPAPTVLGANTSNDNQQNSSGNSRNNSSRNRNLSQNSNNSNTESNDEQAEVLAETDTNIIAQANNNDSNIDDTSDSNDESNQGGFAWYWWLLIALAVLALLYWLFGRRRKADDQ